jgi:hypothetical protein
VANDLNPFVYDDPLPPDQLLDRDAETDQLLTLAEVSRRIEEAYLSALGGPARRAVSAVTRRWRGKVVVTPGGVGGEVEPSTSGPRSVRARRTHLV